MQFPRAGVTDNLKGCKSTILLYMNLQSGFKRTLQLQAKGTNHVGPYILGYTSRSSLVSWLTLCKNSESQEESAAHLEALE